MLDMVLLLMDKLVLTVLVPMALAPMAPELTVLELMEPETVVAGAGDFSFVPVSPLRRLRANAAMV